ncbi:MAG: endolytic transglycosylase MltG [Deltaproteobacteria bacterium]|jgi:UPF0755 protein|nr:endolytic transglycosylase MltG [Deltaproteobacteria bacterium]
MSARDKTNQPPPPPHADGLKRFFLRAALFFSLAALVVLVACFFYIGAFLSLPGSRPSRNVEVIVQPGASFAAVASNLKELGVISDERRFTLLAEWEKQTAKLRAGRFQLNTGWTPSRVLEHLTSGNPILDKITLPEGLPWWEIGRRLEDAGMVRFADFEKVVHDPEFLRHWGIPLKSAEGYLFPDTYLIMRPIQLDEASAKSVVGRLFDTFWRRVATFYESGKKLDASERRHLAEALILASIVEKETALSSERARVAGVYLNRLHRNMILQADPTVIYGIGPGFSGRLRRADLNDAANAYNTYKHPGLPPGPICSPGLASIRAALSPETHNYLYFVARGDGSHQFSTDLASHNQAVRDFIKGARQAP